MKNYLIFLNKLFYGTVFLLQCSCHNPNGQPIKEYIPEPSDSLTTALRMDYNKDNIIVGVEHDRIDSIFTRDSLYLGEKYFASVSRDTLIALKTHSDLTYQYMICVNGRTSSDIFNDYVGFVSNRRYYATKKEDGKYIHRTFKLGYDKTDLRLTMSDNTNRKTFIEVSLDEFEQLTESFLADFVFPRESATTLLDEIPYRGGFINIKISSQEVDASQWEAIKITKGKHAYPDYYFVGKINKKGYAYDVVEHKSNRRIAIDNKLIEEIILKHLKTKEFTIGKFHNLPVNYELNIRVTFAD
ncbi:hypothetical protein FAZ15_21790 [Sphingobacterium olei]|uniref:Uncharacterized protein n=1 Tax=Sphingobacterium olei TaxID=2571155 RepID=A0A4U0N8D6_9SPHI|nr:hypothetical protein [Sphingobacterium olei]TJZ50055.1 hypothetical protein FAZ15_21790 [Sphingobacterium olei]